MAKEIHLPDLGENVTSGTVANILVEVGDFVETGQNIIEIETDKAVAEIPCPESGKVTEIRVSSGDTISVGAVILLLDPQEKAPDEPKAAAAATPTENTIPQTEEKKPDDKAAQDDSTPAEPKARGGAVRAAPSVRQLAREHDVSLEEVPTRDPSGRITAQDVLDFVEKKDTPPSQAPAPSADAADTVGDRQQDAWGDVVIEPMNAIRAKAATHLTQCWTTIPHVTHFDKADITALEQFRKAHAARAESHGVHLTMAPFLIKLLPELFRQFPRMNATVDMDNRSFILKQYCNIGVAVDTPNGLVVPVVHNADQKSVVEIARDMARMAEKARARKLAIEDMQGGGFTVSNLGAMGGHGFTPIVNAPETAILGVSRATMEPVYNGDEFEPRLMLPLSLSYDHRCIDGAEAARFLRRLCEALEQPWNIMLGL